MLASSVRMVLARVVWDQESSLYSGGVDRVVRNRMWLEDVGIYVK